MSRKDKSETKGIKNTLIFTHVNKVKLNISHNLFKGNMLSEHTPLIVLVLLGLNAT